MSGKKGIIEEVSTDRECRQFCATIGLHGFEGDRTGTPGIVILNAEVPHYINTEYGESVLAGQLGDNILVKDMDNLTVLMPGTILRIYAEEVVCLCVVSKAAHYRKMFPKYSEEILAYLDRYGGVICEVKDGIGIRVCDNQDMEIVQ